MIRARALRDAGSLVLGRSAPLVFAMEEIYTTHNWKVKRVASGYWKIFTLAGFSRRTSLQGPQGKDKDQPQQDLSLGPSFCLWTFRGWEGADRQSCPYPGCDEPGAGLCRGGPPSDGRSLTDVARLRAGPRIRGGGYRLRAQGPAP